MPFYTLLSIKLTDPKTVTPAHCIEFNSFVRKTMTISLLYVKQLVVLNCIMLYIMLYLFFSSSIHLNKVDNKCDYIFKHCKEMPSMKVRQRMRRT